MKKSYDPRSVEKKWQKYWKDHQVFKATIDPSKKKFYILDMFPYPSGAGLHVGHVTGYTGTDILARFKRMQGYNVLHPMGWDSFGLPAEQYAIRTGTHPSITTQTNINTYRRQLESLGFSYDWSREIATSDPSYYKWTQWIFTELYKKGLAYEAEINVNYCPALGTVLANEEVEDGKAKEGGYPIERRPLKQWILKITEYADRLISDLDLVDWPDNLKRLQRNWIGKSTGAMVRFHENSTHEEIVVYTTRPDTLFGATYLVLSPEHPLVSKITTKSQQKQVAAYQKETSAKSDLERTELAKDKTGVWTGSYALNPFSGKQIPIWISDYVLSGYGTGAIMCVPAHDERDFAFAKKFNLPIVPVFEPDPNEPLPEDVSSYDELKKQVLTQQRPWTGEGKAIHSQNKEISLDGLSVEKAKEKIIQYLEKNKLGKQATSYKLRDWLFSRQRYWGEPIPILHFEDGTKRALELDELPLIPPQLENYQPAGEGKSPLARAPKWVEIIDPKTKKKAVREINTMPQWAGSCWYYLRFCDPQNDKEAWSDKAQKYWLPVDLYVGGTEHAVLHLMYARFWHKVLYDLKFVSTKEPFQRYRYQGVVIAPSYRKKEGGYVSPDAVEEKGGKYFDKKTHEELIYQIEKMSKSKLNGVSPDEIIEEFGADALRLYEMFMGPFEKEKIWNTDAVSGCYRFLHRFYDIVFSDKVTDEETQDGMKLAHKLVDSASKDIEEMQFNTAISSMMEFTNEFVRLPKYPKKALKMATQMLYPFAPHIGEEFWQELGGKDTITYAPLIPAEKKYLTDTICTYAVQVNGKLRGTWELPVNLTQDKLLQTVSKEEKIAKYLEGKKVKTVIFVPNKLLNIVVEQ